MEDLLGARKLQNNLLGVKYCSGKFEHLQSAHGWFFGVLFDPIDAPEYGRTRPPNLDKVMSPGEMDGILDEFLKLEESDKAAIEFMRRYGPLELHGQAALLASDADLGDYDFGYSDEIPYEIGQYFARKRGVKKYEKKYPWYWFYLIRTDAFWAARENFRRLLRVILIGKERERREVQARAIISQAFPDTKNVQKEIESLVTAGLDSARLEVQYGNAPFIKADDLSTCLYAHIWSDLIRRKPPALCLNCSRLFKSVRPKHVFCEDRCRQAFKKREQRQRHKRADGLRMGS